MPGTPATDAPPPGDVRAGTLELRGVTKRYGPTLAVDDLSLTVPAGKVCVLIGPSGCGKTTALRMVAGLESVTSGKISIGERDVTIAASTIALIAQR